MREAADPVPRRLLYFFNYPRPGECRLRMHMTMKLRIWAFRPRVYGLAASVFFVSYAIFQIPATVFPGTDGGPARGRHHHGGLGPGVRRHRFCYRAAGRLLHRALSSGRGGGGVLSRHHPLSDLLVSQRIPLPASLRPFSWPLFRCPRPSGAPLSGLLLGLGGRPAGCGAGNGCSWSRGCPPARSLSRC